MRGRRVAAAVPGQGSTIAVRFHHDVSAIAKRLKTGVSTSQLHEAEFLRAANVDNVARFECRRPLHPLAVHEGPVAAPKVGEGATAIVERDFCVQPADPRVGDDNVVLIRTTDTRRPLAQGITDQGVGARNQDDARFYLLLRLKQLLQVESNHRRRVRRGRSLMLPVACEYRIEALDDIRIVNDDADLAPPI